MTTKFDIDENVYVVYRNRVRFVEIIRISITHENIVYTFKDPDVHDIEVEYSERLLFKSKEELVKSL